MSEEKKNEEVKEEKKEPINEDIKVSPEVKKLQEELETFKKKYEEAEKKFEEADKKADENEKQVEDWKNKYYGVYADMANTRKQVQRESDDFKKYAQQKFVEELIPALNGFDTVLKKVPTDPNIKSYYDGMVMTHNKLLNVMQQLNVTVIEPAKGDKFDPNTMEPFATVEGENDDLVADTCFKGYKLYDHLIRPACVLVTKKAEKKEEKKDDTKKDEKK
ncbi:MAG: nucleotide exchange factor GrpE [Bacilli bacterium]